MAWGVASIEVEEPSDVALKVRLQNLDSMAGVVGTREVRLKKGNNSKIRFVL